MHHPSVDLGSIPRLADDDPVIIAFSARRDLCAKPAGSSAVRSPVQGTATATALQITIVISQGK
jgi:hypothetical protein